MKKFEALYQKAHDAGVAAVQEAVKQQKIAAMVVGTPTTPFGNDIDPKQPVYYVADGPCGFAWVNIKPGNCRFANWLKKKNLARKDSYYGGVTVWVSEYNQSLQKKEIYAGAFAQVVYDSGEVKSAYMSSRMD
jgi:hypothetical protein